MQIFEGVRIALIAIRSHKMRAALTTLGILIGVMTVIMMLSIVNGIDGQVVGELDAIGANIFYVEKFPALMISSNWRKHRSRRDLKLEYAQQIKRRCPAVAEVSPYHWTESKLVKFKNAKTNPDVVVLGVTETYLDVATDSLNEGRFFTKVDISRNRNVTLLGADVVNTLFPFTDPIGHSVRIDGQKYNVIGTIEKKGSIWGQSQDNQVLIPIELFERRMNRHDKHNFALAVKSRSDVPMQRAIDQVHSAMRIIRNLKAFAPDDFTIETKDQLMTSYKNITGAIFAAAIGIAMISLLVGGIGIMNIMLVSVRERTREIGIRMSVGARRRDILVQFLIEAVTVSTLGGLLGIIAGVGLLKLIAVFMPDLPINITPQTIILALSFSLSAGIFFGVYPAKKAAALDPIECLRYE